VTDHKIETQRTELAEGLRLARERYEPLVNEEVSSPGQSPNGLAPAGLRLAYENLMAAEMALTDFERDHPPES